MIKMIATQTINEQDLEFIERAKLHKILFYEALEAQRLQEDLTRNNDPASGSKRLYSNSEYLNLIEEIEQAKKKIGTKTNRQYNLLNAYEIYEVACIKKIIAKRSEKEPDVRYLVPYEEVFDAIERCHKTVGHKGRDAMNRECKKKHLNLTIELIQCNFYLINFYY